MKKVLKTVLFIILGLSVTGVVGFSLFKNLYVPSHLKNETDLSEIIVTIGGEEEEIDPVVDEAKIQNLPEKSRDELWIDHIKGSDRVNVLLMGTDWNRADTLMFLSYSKKEDNITLITVPRDTYNKVEGKDYLGQDKINAVYCFGGDMGGPDNQRKAVEKILGVPIHYYVDVNYYGLKAIVNALDGIEVDVHRDMYYDDPSAYPPLHIHLEKGVQVLDGDQAMGYVRWRKNNDNTGDSDLARTQRQQEFMLEVVKKSFGLDIVKVIGLTFKHVDTDLTMEDVLYYGTELIGFDFNSVDKLMVPGEADYRYFYHDPKATKEMVQEMYGFE